MLKLLVPGLALAIGAGAYYYWKNHNQDFEGHMREAGDHIRDAGQEARDKAEDATQG
jgi:hypothetical protein